MTATAFGKYQIVEKIGAGGFGEVYKGLDSQLNRYVAVKTCMSDDDELRSRFYREAKIAAGLQHPNIVTVFDFGDQDGMPYLVQEYLAGEDLDHKIRRREPSSMASRLDYLQQIAAGLLYAHSRDVVHRDVKPANVRILEDSQVRIMDFGIAKLMTAETQLTQPGVALGTAAYLPPEQIRGEQVDRRADQFSFGVLAYELMTFERPFAGDSLSAMLYAIAHTEHRPLAGRGGNCPPRLAAMIDRCLAKHPEARYPGFAEVIAELKSLSAMPAIPPLPIPPVPQTSAAASSPATLLADPTAATRPMAARPAAAAEASAESRAVTVAARAVAQPANKAQRSVKTIVIGLLAVGLLAAGLLAAVGLGGWLLNRWSHRAGPLQARTESPDAVAAAPERRQAAVDEAPEPGRIAPREAMPESANQAPETTEAREPVAVPTPTDRRPVPPPGGSPRPAPRPAPPPAPPAAAAPGDRPLIVVKPAGVELGQLAVGERLYADRDFTYQSVPWNLRDLTTLKTSNAHQRAATPFSFTVSRDVEVFVAHDLRIANKPAWLGTFENTELAVTADGDDGERKEKLYQVFVKDFPAGVVTLGANTPPESSGLPVSMYTVFVRPK